MIIVLLIILALVLFLPFSVKLIEYNLEIFLFIMGVIAAIVGNVLTKPLVIKALENPIAIAVVTLVAGLLFQWFAKPLEQVISRIKRNVPFPLFVATIVIVLGLVSSMITAIIAALILVVIMKSICLDRKSEIRLVVLACFSIGLGAALTPIGEPLSTIAISKLNQSFFYLIRLIGIEVISAILFLGILAAVLIHPSQHHEFLHSKRKRDTYETFILQSIKIYLFVMGLTLLGAGFGPLINHYLLTLSPHILFWINMISAILDNATLTAAEISPQMGDKTIKAILLGLLISGGMLVPGNIPNIISAGKLNITSKEWAKFGLPIGLCLMIVYFLIIL